MLNVSPDTVSNMQMGAVSPSVVFICLILRAPPQPSIFVPVRPLCDYLGVSSYKNVREADFPDALVFLDERVAAMGGDAYEIVEVANGRGLDGRGTLLAGSRASRLPDLI